MSNESIIKAYDLLCENLYINAATAVIEEAFSLAKVSPEAKKIMDEKQVTVDVASVEVSQREFLMEFLGDPDGTVFAQALRQFTTDIEGFRKTAFERSVVRGLVLRGDLNEDEIAGAD